MSCSPACLVWQVLTRPKGGEKMHKLFEQPEPDILIQYYDKGEGFWRRVKRSIGNVLRRLRGDAPIGYDERDEFDDEWMR